MHVRIGLCGSEISTYSISHSPNPTTFIDVTRERFYPTVIFLATSKIRLVKRCSNGPRLASDGGPALSLSLCSIVALLNFALVVTVIAAKILKRIYLGDLRPNEVERVNESLRYMIPEVCVQNSSDPAEKYVIHVVNFHRRSASRLLFSAKS